MFKLQEIDKILYNWLDEKGYGEYKMAELKAEVESQVQQEWSRFKANKEAEIADKEAEIADKEAEIADKEAEIADYKKENARLRAELEKRK